MTTPSQVPTPSGASPASAGTPSSRGGPVSQVPTPSGASRAAEVPRPALGPESDEAAQSDRETTSLTPPDPEATGARPSPLLAAALQGQPAAHTLLDAARLRPVHAYLFVGPPGSGMREGAAAFAASLVCPTGGCGQCRQCRLVAAERHPDVVLGRRQPGVGRLEEIRELVALAQRSPLEAGRQVLVVEDVHLLGPVAPTLLKTLEEPPPWTVFVLLAAALPSSLATIASRCVLVRFQPLSPSQVAAVLAAEGVEPERARRAADAAHGRLDRARQLARDPGFAARRAAWAAVPSRLDGSGVTVVGLVDELVASLDAAAAGLASAQAEQLARLATEAAADREESRPSRAQLEDRHRRELRLHRQEELREGLAAIERVYADRLFASPAGRSDALSAVDALGRAGRALVHNPNETLLLQALLLALGRRRADFDD